MLFVVGWLVGCFRFNGPLRQYFSLYRAVSQREGERGEGIDESKNVQTTPTRTYCKCSRPLPYCNPTCRAPRHWKFTQHHCTTRPPPVISESHTHNPKLYWKLLKQLVKSNTNAETIPPLKVSTDNGEDYYFTDEEKANCLNDFFISISTVNDSDASLPAFIPKINEKITNVTITESEIIDTIETLNPNKAVGEDLISHKVLRATKQSLSKPLCALFNISLTESIYPSQWKSALVMPLYKKRSV